MERRTFAIISHPDAGKTTITEKLLLFAGAIEVAGSVKSRKSSLSARSDWMAIEKERGISVTTSTMQFEYQNCLFNLLDTPGHADFSEDTYRTLTAVDAALMILDAAKGVEERTYKLMQICRARHIPVITFINKLDRGALEPLELLDQIEKSLSLIAQPVTWPLGLGRDFKGVYDFFKKSCSLYQHGQNFLRQQPVSCSLEDFWPLCPAGLRCELEEQISLVATEGLDIESYRNGTLTPVYFGSALNSFGVQEILDGFVRYAPAPGPRATQSGSMIYPNDPDLTAFVFKVQANMDPQHRDRVAFCRICSGRYTRGQKLYHVESQKFLTNTQAVSFLGQERTHVEHAEAGDVIGLINHGTISIGDTFCSRKISDLKFKGIVRFAPEIFKTIRPADPLKVKQLNAALIQLSQEGAVQYFKKHLTQELIVGAVGVLQFDVVAIRLEQEYQISCQYGSCSFVTAHWVEAAKESDLQKFLAHHENQIAIDSQGDWVFLAQNRVQLSLASERFPDIVLSAKRECRSTFQ
jgi:peptide chain release factor 3